MIFRDADRYVRGVFGFHFEYIPGAFDSDGRDGHAVLRRRTTVGRPETRLRSAAIVVERIDRAGRPQLTEFPLVGAADERHVVIIDAERCMAKRKNLHIYIIYLFRSAAAIRTF